MLNRAERRRQLREGKTTDKLKRWLSGLNPEQKRLFALTVDEAVNKEVDRISEDTVYILDSCYATAIDDNLDISVNNIKKIVIEANAYMEEVKEYLAKNREDYFMKIDDDKLIEDIKKDIVVLMKEGVIKSKALTQLKNKYKLPANVLNDLWLQVKSEKQKAYNKHTPTKHIPKEVLEEIKKDLKEESEKEKFLQEVGKEIDNKLNEVAIDIELPYVVTEKELEEEIKSSTTLKKVSEVFQGTYDTYTRSENGIKTSKSTFRDIKDLEQYKVGVQAEFEQQKDKLKEQIEELQAKLRKVNEDSIREFNFINEVEEVFNA